MGTYNGTITFNGVSLSLLSATPIRKQKTYKTVIGKTLVQNKVVGMNAQQWDIKVTGIITGTSTADLSAKRAAIEALDDVTPHAYIDGVHNGNYYLLPGTLQFNDSGTDAGMVYRYTFNLIEQ